jgi:hypothetical protein
MNRTVLRNSDTLVTKLAFDMVVAIPLGFSFGVLTKSIHYHFAHLTITFSLVPFILYIICGLMIAKIDKEKAMNGP